MHNEISSFIVFVIQQLKIIAFLLLLLLLLLKCKLECYHQSCHRE